MWLSLDNTPINSSAGKAITWLLLPSSFGSMKMASYKTVEVKKIKRTSAAANSRFLSPFIQKLQMLTEGVNTDLHMVLSRDSTGGSVLAVESVLQVNSRLSYQVIPSHQVVVIDQH